MHLPQVLNVYDVLPSNLPLRFNFYDCKNSWSLSDFVMCYYYTIFGEFERREMFFLDLDNKKYWVANPTYLTEN